MGGDGNPTIPSISSLHTVKNEQQENKKSIMRIVLNKCIEKIVYTNRHTDKTFVIFEVPKLLIGYPSYDMQSCILYLLQKLSSAGYKVDFIEPFYLYIDWTVREPTPPNNTPSLPVLSTQAKQLLQKFPNSTVEFVYETSPSQTSSKKRRKNATDKKKR